MQQPPAFTSDTLAKPKVLKRPAQFSRKAEPAVESVIISAPPMERREGDRRASNRQLAVRLPALPWQEDGRFGLTLIITVAVVNLVLAVALTREPAQRHTPPSAPVISLRPESNSMPAASRTPQSDVTVYSEPTMLEESARSMNLKTYAPNDNDFSIRTDENPAPVARALKDNER